MSASLFLRETFGGNGDKLGPRLWCGLEPVRSEPGGEFVDIHIHPDNLVSGEDPLSNSLVAKCLPFIEGLLHATTVRGERIEGGIRFTAVAGNGNDIGFGEHGGASKVALSNNHNLSSDSGKGPAK